MVESGFATQSRRQEEKRKEELKEEGVIPQDLPMERAGAQMERGAPKNPQPHTFIQMDDSNMNTIPQDQVNHTVWKKPYDRTLFSHKQHEELEALFRENMFPDKNIRKELALKLNTDESRVKVWFRNRRFKLRKQQQQLQQTLKNPSQILPAKENVLPSPRASTSPYSFFAVVSHFYSSLPPQPLGTSNWAWDSVFPENPASNIQIQYPQLESLVATVPALFPDDYDISQIMELYSFPDDEISSSSFSCLYQYLSPKRPQLEGQGNTLSNFAGPAVGLSPERTWSSMTSQGFDAYHVR